MSLLAETRVERMQVAAFNLSRMDGFCLGLAHWCHCLLSLASFMSPKRIAASGLTWNHGIACQIGGL